MAGQPPATTTPPTGVNLYPWDVVGDPRAADRVASLGVDQVTLAAAYHSTRALTPRHPGHRVILARHAAVYFPVAESRWRDRRLRPAAADWAGEPDSFGGAARELRAAGLRVNAWVVLMHNSHLGEANPGLTVRNAYGDRYSWALCPAHSEVRSYAATLAAAVAALGDIDGLELESCGWYGFDHLSGHDKTAGVRLTAGQHYLFSLCFCPACHAAYQAHGVDAARLAQLVRAALDPVFAGAGTAQSDDDAATQATQATQALGADLARQVLAVRVAVADRLRAEVIAAVRDQSRRLPVLLHAHPDPGRCGANAGCDPGTALGIADGLVLSCWGPRQQAVEAVSTAAAAAPAGRRIAASLLAVQGMGGRPSELPGVAAAALAAGATELRLYHAGLASASDLETMRGLVAALRR